MSEVTFNTSIHMHYLVYYMQTLLYYADSSYIKSGGWIS